MELNGSDPRVGPPTQDAASATDVRRADGPATGRPRRRGKSRRKRGSASRRPPPRHGRVFHLIRGLCVVVLVTAGLAGIAAFRLSRGPISLALFKEFIESAITAELGGNRLSIRDAQLALGVDGLEIALTDMRISEPGGASLVQAPRAVAWLSGAAALSGRFGLSRIDLVNPRMQMFYTEDGTLSVKFAPQGDPQVPAAANASNAAVTPNVNGPSVAPATQPAPTTENAGALSFVSTLTGLSAKARRRESAAAYLHEIGLKQATLIVDNGRRKTIWRVPEIKIDLRHKTSGSLIDGRAVIDGLTGPWSLDFHTVESAAAQQLVVLATVHDINPRGLSRQIPALANFEQFDVPLDGETRIDLSSKGVVSAATFELTARPGQMRGQNGGLGLKPNSGRIEAGVIKGAYDAQAARVTFSNVSISVDHNRLDLEGVAARSQALASTGLPLWDFAFSSRGGTLAPASPDGAPVAIDQFHLRGQLVPEAGQVLLQEIALNAGGAAITAKATVTDLAIDASRAADLEAAIAPMPASKLLALWPSTIAPAARSWLAVHMTKGQFNGGTVRLASSGTNRVSMSLELTGTEIMAARGMPPLQIPRARIRVEGGGLDVTASEATLGTGKLALQLKGLLINAVDPADGSPPVAEVAFRMLGPLATALDLADREPFNLLKSRGIVLHAADGRLDGQFKLTLPLSDTVQMADVKTEGHVRLTDGHLRQALGPYDITGAKTNIDISDAAIDTRGDFLLKGIPIKFIGQYFFNSTPDRQSPFRVTFKLDDADRAQLGLDINDLVSGEVPVDVQIGPDAQGNLQAHLSADLTNADLMLDSIAYRKPPGAPALVQFDPVRVANGRTELRNFKITGKSIAAEGLVVLGPDNKARDVSFPELSLNTVSRLELQSHLGADNIWALHAKGSTFDGRDLFRDLFNVQSQSKPVPKTKPGLNMTAEIDTVVGFSDTSLKNVQVKLQKRSDSGFEKTTLLDVTALQDTGKPFSAHIRGTAPGQYKLVATSEDAGQIFKVVGFYPNAAGGRMNLEVDLDGRGAVERAGILKAENFAIFGDPIVNEVFQNSDGASPAHAPRKKVVRERIDFDWMTLPFLVGSGQFVMNDAEIRGPLVGARMRGKVDFQSQRMQVAGTYIPLSGLNSALGGLPILGQLLAGPKGEGMFGFTFLIQGPMANPEVLVNPFSGFVPGILRETQQMAPENFKITPRAAPPPPAPIPTNAARSSSAGPTASGHSTSAALPPGEPADVLPDWASGGKTRPKTATDR